VRGTAAYAAGALLLWNAAFLLVPRLGIWTSVGTAAAILTALALALPVPWRERLAPRPRALLLGLAAAAVLAGASELLYRPLTQAWPALQAESAALFALFGRPDALQAWVLLPAIAAAEELIFRGALLEGLEARLSARSAAGLATALYALAHLASGSWALVGLAAVCGGLWTWLRSRTGSLWPGLLCHVLWDLCILVVLPLR